MNKALVVMAAGLGSRYGGVKQIEKVGPDGEILMEYAIYDALRAGFDKIVLIIKPEMLSDVKALFGDRVERGAGLKICYAFQRMEGEWEGIPIPSGRTKPLGTVHALLSARDYLDRPFAVLNADDFYGAGALAAVGGALSEFRSGGDEAAMVAYRLEHTVSPFGTVTRGVCSVEDGQLKKITETYKIKRYPDGAIRDTSAGEDGPLLAPETPVSMNLWGFHPEILNRLAERFDTFLRNLSPEDDRGECLLPVAMDEFIAAGLRCRVLNTDESWFGLTYPEDKPGVIEALRKLHDSGVYPPRLWQ